MADSNIRYTKSNFLFAIRHFLFGRFVQALAFFILTLVLVRWLNAADYGVYMTILGMVEMMVPLSSLGLLEANRRFLPELATRGSSTSIKSFVIRMLIARMIITLIWSLLIYNTWFYISQWLGFENNMPLVAFYVVTLIFFVQMFRFIAEMLESLMEQKYSQLVRAILPIGQLLIVAILIIKNDNLLFNQVIKIDIVMTSICLIIASFYLYRVLLTMSPVGDYNVTTDQLREFVFHIAGSNILQSVTNYGALRMLVSNRLGVEVAGMFAFLQQLIQIVGRYLPATLLANIIRPMLISKYSKNADISFLNSGLGLMWKSNLLIVVFVVLMLLLTGDELIAVASGNRFTDAGMILSIMFIALTAGMQRQILEMSMQITGRTKEMWLLSFIAPIIPLSVWLGSNYGLIGVSIGLVFATWLWNVAALSWMSYWEDGIVLDWYGGMRILITAVAVFTVSIFFENFNVWLLIIVMGVLYLSLLLIARPVNKNEFTIISTVLGIKSKVLKPFVYKI